MRVKEKEHDKDIREKDNKVFSSNTHSAENYITTKGYVTSFSNEKNRYYMYKKNNKGETKLEHNHFFHMSVVLTMVS